jgi:hypothetical protein
MASTVNSERSRLQNSYAPLRLKILNHYQTVAELVGGDVGARARKLPPKLGHWQYTHSELVHSVCPELIDTIDEIEALSAQRDPHYIKGRHKKQRTGPKPKWQRVGPLNSGQHHELMGEWPQIIARQQK